MTALHAIELALGMALVGVRILFVFVAPIAGAIVERTVSPWNQDGVMMLVVQLSAAVATFAVGVFVFDIPWYASLPAALFVGITSFARRNPEADLF